MTCRSITIYWGKIRLNSVSESVKKNYKFILLEKHIKAYIVMEGDGRSSKFKYQICMQQKMISKVRTNLEIVQRSGIMSQR